jgi:septation ring formation regulator EzrA
MAVNNHALRTIERANEKKGFSFGALMPGMERRKARIVTATFQDAMDTLSTQVERLVIEAEANIDNLNQLEESLNALYELVSREVKSVEGDRDELLALLWTKLGGNQKELKNFKKNLAILKNVGLYRNQARVHVTATLQTLRSLSEDMEEMRERVATPGLVGERIPLEVQMQSIQYGLDRLKENRMKAQRSHEAAVQAVAGAGLDEISA